MRREHDFPQPAGTDERAERRVIRPFNATRAGRRGSISEIPVKCFDKGELAVIGRAAAVANIFGRHISGLPAWLVWAFVHLMCIVEFRSRITVFIEWAIEDLTFSRGAQLITGPAVTDFDFNKAMASADRRRGAA
jgi:hypothetical protein